MDDLIAFLREQLKVDERAALLALKGHDIGDPADMSADARSARWYADYERLMVVTDERAPQQMAEIRDLGGVSKHAAHHIALHQPARVLAEVDAKKQILERYERAAAAKTSVSSFVRGQDDGYLQALEDTLRLLALPFADRPGYQEAWRT